LKELILALKSGIGWLSTIPVGISMEGVEALMNHVYIFPFVGMALGAILGGISYIALQVFPMSMVAVVVIVAIYWLCGINHIDGLADFADGVIAHGTREKKIAAMKDVYLGTGGGLYIVVIILASFSILSSLPGGLMPLAVLSAEVSAKEAMICFAAFSRPLQKGFGQIMIQRTHLAQFLFGLVISAVICSLTLGALGLAGLAAAQLTALYLVGVAKRNFGGATGDGIGATNELARVAALAAALVLGGVLPWTLW